MTCILYSHPGLGLHHHPRDPDCCRKLGVGWGGVFTSRACVHWLQGTQAEGSSEQYGALCRVDNPEPWYPCWAARPGKVKPVSHGT